MSAIRKRRRGRPPRADFSDALDQEFAGYDLANSQLFQRPAAIVGRATGQTTRRIQQLRRVPAYILIARMHRKDLETAAVKYRSHLIVGDNAALSDIGFIEFGRLIKGRWRADGSKFPLKSPLLGTLFLDIDEYVKHLWESRQEFALPTPSTPHKRDR